MKKLFVSCMIAFMAICSVGAQEVYIGGGFTVGSEDSEFVFQISPEVGCHLTDQWAVGGEIGYTHYDDYNRFQFAPYARYTFYKTGIVGLFVDGTIGIAAGDGDTGFRLGLRPGLSLKYNRQNEKYEFSKRKVQEETFEYSLNEVRTSLFHSVILYPFERSHIEFKQDIFTTFN